MTSPFTLHPSMKWLIFVLRCIQVAGEIIFPAIVGPTGHILFQFVTNISTQYLTRLDREIHEPIFDKILINKVLTEFQEYFRAVNPSIRYSFIFYSILFNFQKFFNSVFGISCYFKRAIRGFQGGGCFIFVSRCLIFISNVHQWCVAISFTLS